MNEPTISWIPILGDFDCSVECNVMVCEAFLILEPPANVIMLLGTWREREREREYENCTLLKSLVKYHRWESIEVAYRYNACAWLSNWHPISESLLGNT